MESFLYDDVSQKDGQFGRFFAWKKAYIEIEY